MATVLDLTFFEFFMPAFVFLFILVFVFAMLVKTKLLGESKPLLWVVSISLAFLALFTGSAIDLINFITPWFIVLGVFLLLLFLLLMFIGIKQEEIPLVFGGKTTIFIVTLIILIAAVSNVFGPVFSPYEVDSENGSSIGGEALRTIFHPRILAAMLILIITSFVVKSFVDVSA